MSHLGMAFRNMAVLALLSLAGAFPARAQQDVADGPRVIELTPESMVRLALESSYQVQYLNMSVEQTRQQLRAQRARLRSRVDLEVSAPEFESISDEVYDSNLGRNVIVHEDSRRWEAELSIRQPVIVPFLGYPTNGYLSLNNRVYRYLQFEDQGERDLTYYNRYFVRYTQPFFQPNELKNSLEEAELELEEAELDFYDDMIEVVDDASDEYFDLFESAYAEVANDAYVSDLEAAVDAAEEVVADDPDRGIELDQIRVELANARENLEQARTSLRLQTASLRTELSLPPTDSVFIVPEIDLEPVAVNRENAISYALELTPRMRSLAINRRGEEIDLEETEGRNSFQLDVELTYGREMRDPIFGNLWMAPSNTYTIDVNASIPIWDWGERDARIESARISLDRALLRIDQAESEIVSDVENQVRNVQELQARTLTMEENLALASQISAQSLDRYRSGTLTLVDLLQSLRRERDTSENFVDAYLGWRSALARLQQLTYYDFEYDMPVLERYEINVDAMQGFGPSS